MQGADCFKATINLEVQWANEQSIAAVERNGGVLTTAYYDVMCVTALSNPEKWFKGINVKGLDRNIEFVQNINVRK